MTTCPKCSYTRTATDAAPASECPSCGVIYAKYDPAADARRRELIAAAARIKAAAQDAADRSAWNESASDSRGDSSVTPRRVLSPLAMIAGGILVVLFLVSLRLPKPQASAAPPEKPKATEVVSRTAVSSPVYTPEQLRAMIARGQYPAQGPASSEAHDMSFDVCAAQLHQVLGAIAADYPARVVANVPGSVRSEKVWANDGTVLITCTAPDNKMVITRSAYQ